MMKVGILLDGDPDFPGGVQTYVKGLYQFLQKAGHQAVIIAGGEEGESERKGFKVARVGKSPTLPGIGTQISAYTDWIGKEEIEKITEKERLEILHLQGMFGVLGMRFLDHARTPSVATFHNYLEPERLPVSLPLLFPLFDHYIKKLDGRIAVSQPALEFANQVSPGEYAVIPPGIDLGRFKNAYRDHFPAKGLTTILYVGRLDKRKGILFLLEAFKKIGERISDVGLVIVGSGPLEAKAKEFAAKNKLRGVRFVGFVNEEKLPRFFAEADLYCTPATHGESFGIVLLEAMASGLPVVAFANAGYREVLKGEGAEFLVPPEDVEGLAKVLITLVKDEELRKRMSRWSLKEVEQYSWDNVGPRILKVYERARLSH